MWGPHRDLWGPKGPVGPMLFPLSPLGPVGPCWFTVTCWGPLGPVGPFGPFGTGCPVGPLGLLVPWPFGPVGPLALWACWPLGPLGLLVPLAPWPLLASGPWAPLGPGHWAMGPHMDHSKSAKVLVDWFRQGVEKTFYSASCDLVAALKHRQSPNAFKCKRNMHRPNKSGL